MFYLVKMNLLFICSRNRLRSPTAEAIFSVYEGIEAMSAGTSPDADHSVSAELIDWADIVFAMERNHRRRLQERFAALLRTKQIVVLDIQDNYKFMDAELIRVLEEKVNPYLRNKMGERSKFHAKNIGRSRPGIRTGKNGTKRG
jgi:predicted protein tyrosine phosphatase